MKWLACLVLVLPVVASAGPTKKQLEWTLTNRGDTADAAVKFGFDSVGAHESARTWAEANGDRRDLIELRDSTIATAADGLAAWAATGARRGTQCAGLTGTIDKCKDLEEPAVSVLVLYEKDAKDAKRWNPVVVHSAIPLSGKDHAKRVADGAKLAPIANKVDTAAEPAVAVFRASLADPKQLAASVSKRKDVILLGSAPKEKFVGGAKVAATLAKWKLALSVRDGIAAGVTASKTVAWVAANVDAATPAGTATPYRVLALYEKGKDWRLVALTFSFTSAPTAHD